MTVIGFIGLGNMGLPMVKNLLGAGHSVRAFDLVTSSVAAAADAGATACASAAEAVKGAEIVITMVPAGQHVRAVYLGEEAVLDHAEKEALLIDCSTIDVATAREVNEAATAAGYAMVDAPVSGGVGGAEAGTLTFMVGGTDVAFARAKPYLEIMGGKIFHTGAAGTGQAVKICNNMMLAISMIGVSEMFALGRRLGLADQVLFDVASTSSARCWSLDTYCPIPGPVPTSPANRDYKAGFTVDMMLKDLRLAKTAAESTHSAIPLGGLAESLYAKFSEGGDGGLDFSGIFKMIERKSTN